MLAIVKQYRNLFQILVLSRFGAEGGDIRKLDQEIRKNRKVDPEKFERMIQMTRTALDDLSTEIMTKLVKDILETSTNIDQYKDGSYKGDKVLVLTIQWFLKNIVGTYTGPIDGIVSKGGPTDRAVQNYIASGGFDTLAPQRQRRVKGDAPVDAPISRRKTPEKGQRTQEVVSGFKETFFLLPVNSGERADAMKHIDQPSLYNMLGRYPLTQIIHALQAELNTNDLSRISFNQFLIFSDGDGVLNLLSRFGYQPQWSAFEKYKEARAVVSLLNDYYITQTNFPRISTKEQVRILLDFNKDGISDKGNFFVSESELMSQLFNHEVTAVESDNFYRNLGYEGGVSEVYRLINSNFYSTREELRRRLGNACAILKNIGADFSVLLHPSGITRAIDYVNNREQGPNPKVVDAVGGELKTFLSSRGLNSPLVVRELSINIAGMIGSSFGVGGSVEIPKVKEFTRGLIQKGHILFGYHNGQFGAGIRAEFFNRGGVRVGGGMYNFIPFIDGSYTHVRSDFSSLTGGATFFVGGFVAGGEFERAGSIGAKKRKIEDFRRKLEAGDTSGLSQSDSAILKLFLDRTSGNPELQAKIIEGALAAYGLREFEQIQGLSFARVGGGVASFLGIFVPYIKVGFDSVNITSREFKPKYSVEEIIGNAPAMSTDALVEAYNSLARAKAIIQDMYNVGALSGNDALIQLRADAIEAKRTLNPRAIASVVRGIKAGTKGQITKNYTPEQNILLVDIFLAALMQQKNSIVIKGNTLSISEGRTVKQYDTQVQDGAKIPRARAFDKIIYDTTGINVQTSRDKWYQLNDKPQYTGSIGMRKGFALVASSPTAAGENGRQLVPLDMAEFVAQQAISLDLSRAQREKTISQHPSLVQSLARARGISPQEVIRQVGTGEIPATFSFMKLQNCLNDAIVIDIPGVELKKLTNYDVQVDTRSFDFTLGWGIDTHKPRDGRVDESKPGSGDPVDRPTDTPPTPVDGER